MDAPARWPLVLVWTAALVFCAVLVTEGTTAEPRDVPPPAPASGCVASTTSYPDGSVWHRCTAPELVPESATPPPAELPTDDPFTEE